MVQIQHMVFFHSHQQQFSPMDINDFLLHLLHDIKFLVMNYRKNFKFIQNVFWHKEFHHNFHKLL